MPGTLTGAKEYLCFRMRKGPLSLLVRRQIFGSVCKVEYNFNLTVTLDVAREHPSASSCAEAILEEKCQARDVSEGPVAKLDTSTSEAFFSKSYSKQPVSPT